MNNNYISPINENALLAAQQCSERAERHGASLDAAIIQFVRERLWKLSVEDPNTPEFTFLLRALFHHWKLETMGNRRKRSLKHQERLVRHLFGSLPEVVPYAQSQQINTHAHKSTQISTQPKHAESR